MTLTFCTPFFSEPNQHDVSIQFPIDLWFHFFEFISCSVLRFAFFALFCLLWLFWRPMSAEVIITKLFWERAFWWRHRVWREISGRWKTPREMSPVLDSHPDPLHCHLMIWLANDLVRWRRVRVHFESGCNLINFVDSISFRICDCVHISLCYQVPPFCFGDGVLCVQIQNGDTFPIAIWSDLILVFLVDFVLYLKWCSQD